MACGVSSRPAPARRMCRRWITGGANARIGAQGTEGFAEVLTGGGWRAVTHDSGGVISGEGCMNYDLDMPPYIADMAKWLDDDTAVHPCNGEEAYKGFEIMMGICRSVVERGQIQLPLPTARRNLKNSPRFFPKNRYCFRCRKIARNILNRTRRTIQRAK